MGYLTNFYRDSQQKELKTWRRKVKRRTKIQSSDRLEIKFKVSYDVIESVNFAEFHGFYDVTGKLDFRSIGWLYLGAAYDFSSSVFQLFLMASIKIGQVQQFSPTRYPRFIRQLIFFLSVLGANSLAYLSVEGLVKAVRFRIHNKDSSQLGHCTACLTGEYPEKVEW